MENTHTPDRADGPEAPVDLLIVGGGINGAGIARDAAGRGLSVLLCEQDDLASHTSSASTKLIHGGLRYLEYYEFRLVREALIEREVLLAAAPHIIWPLRFVLPHVKGLRPAWMIRLGLFLYDHLGGRKKLPGCESLNLTRHVAGAPLSGGLRKGFAYSDCWVQDARLVVLNAMDARARGADIRTRTEFVDATRADGVWQARLRNRRTGALSQVRARALVNAAGPWCEEVLRARAGAQSQAQIRLVKGSHIVVPRLFDHDYCYIFQNPDNRIVFAIPYERDFTLIGTTDLDYSGDPGAVRISDDEISYLCTLANRYFDRQVGPGDVVWSYSGVRPLYGDDAKSASAVTRDYVLDLDTTGGQAPLLNIFGGKITTYRRLAEQALSKLCGALGRADAPWTAGAPLPGGSLPDGDFEAFVAGLKQRYSWMPDRLRYRLARNYGTMIAEIVGEAAALDDLGRCFGADLYEAELRYLVAQEWALEAEDVLWRRSKLGLRVPADAVPAIQAWLTDHLDAPAAEVAARAPT